MYSQGKNVLSEIANCSIIIHDDSSYLKNKNTKQNHTYYINVSFKVQKVMLQTKLLTVIASEEETGTEEGG